MQKAAVEAKSVEEIPGLAMQLMTHRPARGAILWTIERCAKPYAAFTIADSIRPLASVAA